MAESTWGVITQELLLFADATVSSDWSVEVPVNRAAALRQVLDNPWPGKQWPWQWTPAAMAAADEAGGVDDALATLLSADPRPAVSAAAVDTDLEAAGFERKLLPAQAVVVGKLLAAGNGGNFSVPGSGKTTMTLALFALMRAKGIVDRLLVVAPASAYEAWTVECFDCFPDGDRPRIELTPSSPRRSTDVVVYNYNRLAIGAIRATIDGWAQAHRLMVVFDEAHRAKRGEDGLHGAAARDIAQLASARFVLTGTPMPNRRDDLAAILDLAWPGHGDRLADPSTVNADRVWARITKHDLELADPVVSTEYVHLDEAHRSIYDAYTAGLKGELKVLKEHSMLANRSSTGLVAAASNPMLLLGGDTDIRWGETFDVPDTLQELVRDLADRVRPAKLLRVAQYAAEHADRGEKLLVWTNYLGNVRELSRLLAPHQPAIITGAIPVDDPTAPTDRARELNRFRTDPNCIVLIATPQTLGEGVSLHKACQSQIHVDRTFNAGLFLQAIDRTHRVGMPEGTTSRVRVLMARHTIDELVHEALRRKIGRMSQALNDHTLKQLSLPDPDEPSAVTTLTADEIRELVAHLMDGG